MVPIVTVALLAAIVGYRYNKHQERKEENFVKAKLDKNREVEKEIAMEIKRRETEREKQREEKERRERESSVSESNNSIISIAKDESVSESSFISMVSSLEDKRDSV